MPCLFIYRLLPSPRYRRYPHYVARRDVCRAKERPRMLCARRYDAYSERAMPSARERVKRYARQRDIMRGDKRDKSAERRHKSAGAWRMRSCFQESAAMRG